MPESQVPARFAARSALSIAATVALACAVMRFAFADSPVGWMVTATSAAGGSVLYFALALRRCRAAERLASRVPLSRTQPSR